MSGSSLSTNETVAGRFQHGIIGGIAGLSLWFCFDELPRYFDSDRGLAFLAALLLIFFSSTLLMAGPLVLRRAAGAALLLSVFGSMLFLWASFRFESLEDFYESIYAIIALGLLTLISLPFLVAAQLADTHWRDYDRLFDQAWSMFVRGVIGSLFSGVFWLILFASDALLSLVGVTILDVLMGKGWFASSFTGATFGLALGVLNEHQRIVSTVRGLALRLLRLMLPVVAVVGTIFVALLPVRGLDQVFGDLSAAGTLIAMAMVALSLVAASIDGTDETAAQSRIMAGAARLLCIVLPVVTCLALYALWIRIQEYGWTPERIAGALSATVLCGYGLFHVASFARGAAWRNLIRTGNTLMALAIIAISALLLTPVLNLERISATDQLARFQDGRTSAQDVPYRDFYRDWGLAGREAWSHLESLEDHPEQVLLDHMMQDTQEGTATRTSVPETTAEDLAAILPVRPEGSTVPDGFLDALPDYTREELAVACEGTTENNQPLCVMVVADLNLALEGDEAVLVWALHADAEPRIAIFSRDASGRLRYGSYANTIGASRSTLESAEIIQGILAGTFAVRQPEFHVLDLGSVIVLPPHAQE